MKYMDKKGNVIDKKSGQDTLLNWMYSHCPGRMALKILVQPAISRAVGWVLNTRISKIFIPPFVKRNKIDLSVCEKQSFDSYNDFFKRQIKRNLRPLEGDAYTFISPCDGKLSVYQIDGGKRFWIKHTPYTLQSLLRSKKLAECYNGGYACIFRLTVDDYHRYCYIDDGEKSDNYHIPGVYHTVNPAANDVIPIYKENTREFSLLRSRHFKTVLMMEVGALLVGRITNYHEACEVNRGQEKGCFEFGGSTVIVLFQKNAVRMDERIIENTNRGYETIVRMGERLGESADKYKYTEDNRRKG